MVSGSHFAPINQGGGGVGQKIILDKKIVLGYTTLRCGGVPERPNGADLKSDGARAHRGSNPLASAQKNNIISI